MDDVRQRVTRWMQEAPSVLDTVARLLDDRQRALAAAEQAERECERLRGELGAVRADSDLLKRERSETMEAVAEALGKAGDALARLRAPLPGPSADPDARAGADPLVTGPAPTAAPAAEPRTEPPVQKRILLVDDDANFRGVILEYLAGFRGYDVQVAVCGEDALALLEGARPDLVLLDLMMPGIGGMATLQRIKAQHPDQAVVMVTANEDLSIARRALALGAADYVTKPFDLDYLDAVLDIYLNPRDPREEPEPAPLAAAGGIAAAARSLRTHFARR